ncbi:tetratricopeptide repeat protein [Actinosynnema sp. NPDC050801]|uniref:ATP-binding protein n=1 Tax=unclassified Actinosynnema TaxID=2637065 RepID=UPI00340CE348
MVEGNVVSGRVHGPVVQAHTIHGGVHVHAPALMVPRQLPHNAPHLVGRSSELEALESGSRSNSRIVVISGTAGVGKTTLCLHWARSVADRFTDGQLYVDLRGFDPSHPPLSTAEAVRGFLDGFGVPPERIPAEVAAQVNLYRSVVADRRALVVLDNARDADQVRALLPGGTDCVVAVTSRTELTGLTVREGVRRIALGVLGEADSRRLIADRLDGAEVDDEAVGELAARCAGLPLALAVVAGRAAQQRSFPLGVLVEELRSATQRLDSLDTGDPHTTARSVFSWSYEALPGAARRTFRLLGATTGADIALPAAASLLGLPLPPTRSVLNHLVRANLMEEYAPGRFRSHDLLREYAAERLAEELETERTAAVTRMIESYLHTAIAADAALSPHRLRITVPPPVPGVSVSDVSEYHRAVEWFVAEHQLVVGAVAHAAQAGLDRHAWQLAWAAVTYLRRFSHIHDRLRTQRQALAAARALGDRYAEAKICRVLGKTLLRHGREAEAEDFIERAVALFHHLEDQAEEADALLSRAKFHRRRGAHAEADTDAHRALALAEAAGSTNLRATALNSAARCALHTGIPERAITYSTKALALYQGIDNAEGAADALRVLGSAHTRLGRWDEAIKHYEESLALDLALHDDYYAALVLNEIGVTHRAAGRHADATTAWHRSLALMEHLDPQEAEEVRDRLRVAEAASGPVNPAGAPSPRP